MSVCMDLDDAWKKEKTSGAFGEGRTASESTFHYYTVQYITSYYISAHELERYIYKLLQTTF